MSHEITDTDTMAYLGETPWHKLGTVIDANDTFEQAWAKGGLTWSISKQQLSFTNSKGERENCDRVAIVRDDNGEVLGTAGGAWECYQNTEIRDSYLQPMIDSGLVKLETMGSLFGGKKVWALARVTGATKEIGKGDAVNLFVLAAQGHDGTMGLFLGGTAVRVVCNNTLQASLSGGGQLRVRHTKNMRDTVTAVRDAIMSSINNFDKTCELFGSLASRDYNNAQLTTYLNTLFPKNTTQADIKAQAATDGAQAATDGAGDFAALLAKPWVDRRTADEVFSQRAQVVASRAHDRILEILQGNEGGQQMEGVKGTAWGAYNAVTHFLTHERGRSPDARMSALAFGGSAGIGAKALSIAADTFLS